MPFSGAKDIINNDMHASSSPSRKNEPPNHPTHREEIGGHVHPLVGAMQALPMHGGVAPVRLQHTPQDGNGMLPHIFLHQHQNQHYWQQPPPPPPPPPQLIFPRQYPPIPIVSVLPPPRPEPIVMQAPAGWEPLLQAAYHTLYQRQLEQQHSSSVVAAPTPPQVRKLAEEMYAQMARLEPTPILLQGPPANSRHNNERASLYDTFMNNFNNTNATGEKGGGTTAPQTKRKNETQEPAQTKKTRKSKETTIWDPEALISAAMAKLNEKSEPAASATKLAEASDTAP